MTALIEKIRDERRSIAEEVNQLFAETNQFLSVTRTNRIAQTQEQAQRLHKFHENLKQETRGFLVSTATKRTAQAQAQKQYLHQFRQDLFVSIFGSR